MEFNDAVVAEAGELRPIIGLTRGLPNADLERLSAKAMRTHRQLVAKADHLFQALPEDYKTGRETGGAQHLEFIEAMIEMHTQMNALNTLIDLLGFIPKVSVN